MMLGTINLLSETIQMMEQMKFPIKWRQWIKECISTATANVLVNGSPSGEFRLERGVRQGDLLSPFLFLIIAEAISILVNRAVDREMMSPVEVGTDRIRISHLQYADDTLFMVEGSMDNAKAIKWILRICELMSGLKVNFDKCRVFGLNIPENEVNEATEMLGCQVGELPLDYLGMKVGSGLNKLVNWEGLVEKVRKRLEGWNVKSVSLSGRVTLINVVLNAIPIFRMTFAPIPVGTTAKIRSLQTRFLWGDEEGGVKKIAWFNWEELCRSKREGGLGIKNLRWFNWAFLGKWLWMFVREKDGLCVKVIKSRHGQMLSFGNGGSSRRRGSTGSGWWNRILTAMSGDNGSWFSSRLRRVIGNGANTKFWEDWWYGDVPLKERFPRFFHLTVEKDAAVSEMGRWDDGLWI